MGGSCGCSSGRRFGTCTPNGRSWSSGCSPVRGRPARNARSRGRGSTCAEIDNCRPYFIGILAGRYGWVPEGGGRSLTELEIAHGALDDPRAAHHTRSSSASRTRPAMNPRWDDSRSAGGGVAVHLTTRPYQLPPARRRYPMVRDDTLRMRVGRHGRQRRRCHRQAERGRGPAGRLRAAIARDLAREPNRTTVAAVGPTGT
ncbi:DUF4062 domain-containing protein [Virgisporangium aurantiacum]|uniref:DUF4062 domain-containing protein n=1 Tax=Virgisporangium aurantiacum TaxID=175570 RepID=UPI00194F3D2D